MSATMNLTTKGEYKFMSDFRSMEMLMFARIDVRYWWAIVLYLVLSSIVRFLYLRKQGHPKAVWSLIPLVGDLFFFDDTVNRAMVIASAVCFGVGYLMYSSVFLVAFFILRILYCKSLCEIEFNNRNFLLYAVSLIYRGYNTYVAIRPSKEEHEPEPEDDADIDQFVGSKMR